MAVERVQQLLMKVTGTLDQAGVPYAVIGGNAVAAWVSTKDPEAIRTTKDVDILVRRQDFAALTTALQKIDLMPVEVLGVSMFVEREHPSPKSGVHLVFVGERIRAHYVHAPPDLLGATRSDLGYQVIDLPSLVAMKLQANRAIDQAHMIDLKSVGLIDDDLIRRIPPDLRERLLKILEAPE
jgi:hypothetical protein